MKSFPIMMPLGLVLACHPTPNPTAQLKTTVPTSAHQAEPGPVAPASQRPTEATTSPVPQTPLVLTRKPHSPRPAAISGTPFGVPPPWPAQWCVSHDAVWSDALAIKHGLGMGQETFQAGCGWSWSSGTDERRVNVGISAGLAAARFATPERGRARFDAGLGRPIQLKSTSDSSLLRVWSDGPPYHLSAVAEGMPQSEAEQRVRALAKDVLKGFDKTKFRKPRAELVFIYPNHPERARAVLDHWARLAPIFEATLPLAPGFPKMVKVNDFTWDPGKRPGEDWRWKEDGSAPPDDLLLLAICPSGAGNRLVEASASLPVAGRFIDSIATYVASAEGLGVQCPAGVMDDRAKGRNAELTFEDKPIKANTIEDSNPQTGEFTLYGTMAYSDPAGLPIDYLPFELHKPVVPGRDGEPTSTLKTVGKCETRLDPDYVGAPKVRLVCEAFRTDLSCGVPDYLGTELDFAIVDGRMTVESELIHIPGRDCIPISKAAK